MVRLAELIQKNANRINLRMESLESREVPAGLGLEDVYSMPQLPGMGDVYPINDVAITAMPTTKHAWQLGEPLRAMPRDRFAIATGPGQPTQVNVYDSETGGMIGILTPFDRNYTHGVSVSVGDITGDGVQDIIVGSGSGSTPVVKVFDGKTLAEIKSFFAYEQNFLGGVGVAAGDVTGDGRADIITGAGLGGGPRVQVFSGWELFPNTQNRLTVEPSPLRNFFAYSESFNGGVNVAVGDVNGDGTADIVTGAGAGGGPHVMVFDGKSGDILKSFFAYDSSLRHGVNVSVGQFNGESQATIVTALMTGGGLPVRFYEPGQTTPRELNVFPNEPNSGTSVALRDINADGTLELIAATGKNSSPQVKVLNPFTGIVIREFPGFMPDMIGGLYVG